MGSNDPLFARSGCGPVRGVGAAAWVEHENAVEIDKVMVRPTAHRQGIASRLLEHVIDAANDRQVATATGRDNAPARALYGKHGFADVGDELVRPGIWITRLTRVSPDRS